MKADDTPGVFLGPARPFNYDRVGCIYSFYIQATAFYAFDIVIRSPPFLAEACPKRLRVLNNSLAVSIKEGGKKKNADEGMILLRSCPDLLLTP